MCKSDLKTDNCLGIVIVSSLKVQDNNNKFFFLVQPKCKFNSKNYFISQNSSLFKPNKTVHLYRFITFHIIKQIIFVF